MGEPLFVDTGYLIALIVADDVHAEEAAAWCAKIRAERTPLVTSAAILIELGDGFAKARKWGRARIVIDALRSDPIVSVVTVDESVLSRALALRDTYADKDWGLTDCTSFVIMREQGISAALACDSHFQQAGFRALLIE